MESGRRRLRSCFASMSPGGLRVTVRPYYEGLPANGLDAGRMKAGESLPDQGGECPCPSPEVTVPGPKIAAVERRKACALSHKARAAAPQCAAEVSRQRLSALCPLRRLRRMGASPLAASPQRGIRETSPTRRAPRGGVSAGF